MFSQAISVLLVKADSRSWKNNGRLRYPVTTPKFVADSRKNHFIFATVGDIKKIDISYYFVYILSRNSAVSPREEFNWKAKLLGKHDF